MTRQPLLRKARFPGVQRAEIWGDGGAEGDRTPDLRNAIATLSQLSYGPTTLRP